MGTCLWDNAGAWFVPPWQSFLIVVGAYNTLSTQQVMHKAHTHHDTGTPQHGTQHTVWHMAQCMLSTPFT